MWLEGSTIQGKLVKIVLLTSGAVLLLACSTILTYEFITFRQTTLQQASTVGQIIAANSTAALAFHNSDDANEILAALKVEKPIVAAGLYDLDGNLFSHYPANGSVSGFPQTLQEDGYQFSSSKLVGFQPVIQGTKRLGTLYLKWDMTAIYAKFEFYGASVIVIMTACFLVAAFALSRILKQQISQPILALVETAKVVSDSGDYTVRATKMRQDELGSLTDSFNHMLGQIHEQNTALGESEARVRAVLNSALSAVIVIDAQGRIIEWNPRAAAMFGWTSAEALGKELAETIIPPRFRDGHRHGMERMLSTGEGSVLNRVLEMTAIRRDGTEFPVELSIGAMDTGGVQAFCGFITDTTDRKQAEIKIQNQLSRLELLDRITRATAERHDVRSIFQVTIQSLEQDLPIDFGCICLYDRAKDVLTVTNVGGRSETLAMELSLINQTRIAVDHDGLESCLNGQLVYEPDVRSSPFPFPQRLARGGLCSLVLTPLLTEGKVFGILIVARIAAHAFDSGDCEFLRQLSEPVGLAARQSQLHRELQQAYDELRMTQEAAMQQERLRVVGTMASGIAHDINNALSPVALYTEALLEKEPNLSTRARDYLQVIQHAIGDVAETIARMREFYREHEPQMALTPVQMNDLIRQVTDLTHVRWSDMPQQLGIMIELQTALATELPTVQGVESEIRQGLINLIFNAVDAMPNGGTLTLRTYEGSRSDKTGSKPKMVHVEVSDTGTGMSEETRRRCLEPFFTTKGERGTGLGLAMVFGVMQRHTGGIEIDSAPGKGTTVRLSFPLAVIDPSESIQPIAISVTLDSLRILVVDDDPLLLKSLRDTLEGDGHVVVTANGGQAGIDAFVASGDQGKSFDVVVTDLGMPYVDGRKVASAIKDISPSTPVILLTGWGQRLVAEGEVPPFVDRVLSKPPRLRELREALVQCCKPKDTEKLRKEQRNEEI